MVFGFLTRRKDSVPQAVEETPIAGPSTDTQQAQLRTPSPSIHDADDSPSRDPPVTPSPPPEVPLEQKVEDLRSLIQSIPAKILHTYTLSRLDSTDQLSADALSHVASFFSELVPPPKLHCVRCHKSYFEVENTNRSCLVAHDDDSAEVERVASNSTTFETLWGCCGRTTEGDGNMGPPDGWCYEGKHTTDRKRARFRADSSINDDKLMSCERMRCNAPPRPARSTRKRARATVDEDSDEDEKQSNASNPTSVSESPESNKGKRASKKPRTSRKSIGKLEEAGVPTPASGTDDMDVDSEPAAPVPPSPKPRPRAKPKPTSPKARALTTPKTSSPLVKSIALESSPEPSEPQKPSRKPRSSAAKAVKPKSSRASLRRAVTPEPNDSENNNFSSSRVEVVLPSKSHSRAKSVTIKDQGDSDTPTKPKPRARARGKTKSLGEVVDSSVVGERP